MGILRVSVKKFVDICKNVDLYSGQKTKKAKKQTPLSYNDNNECRQNS